MLCLPSSTSAQLVLLGSLTLVSLGCDPVIDGSRLTGDTGLDACADPCWPNATRSEASLDARPHDSLDTGPNGSADAGPHGSPDARRPGGSDARPNLNPDARLDASSADLSDTSPGSCPEETLSAELVEPRMYRRDEAVRIDFTVAPGRELEVTAPQGGRIVMREDHLFYSAGAGEDGDLGWPHWTGEVPVRLTTQDPDLGCTARVEIRVTMAGDVLNGDFSTGRILAFGSGGQHLGTFAPLSGRRILHMTVISPTEAFEGGLAVLRWTTDNESFDIVLFDRQGTELPVRFETLGLNGEPLYTPEVLPQNLIAHNGEILGDHGPDCQIHRWSLQGDYLGDAHIPCHDTLSYKSVGFGRVDGDVVIGWYDGPIRFYDLEGNLRVQGPRDSGRMRHIRPGPGGDTVAITQGDYGGNALSFDAQGEPVGSITVPVLGFMTRFMDGYLHMATDDRLQQRRRDMRLVRTWPREAQASAEDLGALVWLDDNRPDR